MFTPTNFDPSQHRHMIMDPSTQPFIPRGYAQQPPSRHNFMRPSAPAFIPRSQSYYRPPFGAVNPQGPTYVADAEFFTNRQQPQRHQQSRGRRNFHQPRNDQGATSFEFQNGNFNASVGLIRDVREIEAEERRRIERQRESETKDRSGTHDKGQRGRGGGRGRRPNKRQSDDYHQQQSNGSSHYQPDGPDTSSKYQSDRPQHQSSSKPQFQPDTSSKYQSDRPQHQSSSKSQFQSDNSSKYQSDRPQHQSSSKPQFQSDTSSKYQSDRPQHQSSSKSQFQPDTSSKYQSDRPQHESSSKPQFQSDTSSKYQSERPQHQSSSKPQFQSDNSSKYQSSYRPKTSSSSSKPQSEGFSSRPQSSKPQHSTDGKQSDSFSSRSKSRNDPRTNGRPETSHLLKSMGPSETPRSYETAGSAERNYGGRGGKQKQNWMSWRQREANSNNISKGGTKEEEQQQQDFSYNKSQHVANNSRVSSKPLFKFNDFTSDSALNTQRDRLAEQLRRGKYECMVCYEFVRQNDRIWHCSQCFNIFHLKCIVRWSKSQEQGQDWRCPACQEEKQVPPGKYKCFCSKYEDPQWDRYLTPHTCGEVCSLLRPRFPQCTHPCTLLCHPGPCPPCKVTVNRSCPCGKTSSMQVCGSTQNLGCGNKCEKKLKCGVHFCEQLCHSDDCQICDQILQKVCHCSKSTQSVSCTKESNVEASFSCATVCAKRLECGHHECDKICHPGDCPPCTLLPSTVDTCWCGQQNLDDILETQRSSCLDPVPSCGKPCNKQLQCGPEDENHRCEEVCHEGRCPPCQKTTTAQCMCRYKKTAVPCSQLAEGFLCDKKCNKRLTCLHHKCLKVCCTEDFHVCPQICNRTLSCGLHKCERLCHAGNCPPCQNTSFEELYCRCGHSKMFPPVPCGTKRPECDKPCNRQHACDHEPLHNCHDQPDCPPCFVLCYKWCYGRHEIRKAVPCHTVGLSCGRPCKGELPCQRHTCTRNCHEGSCLKEGQICSQPCQNKRPFCGHPCNVPCHPGPCPDTPCTQQIKVSCQCKHRSLNRNCSDNTKEFQIMSTSLLASTMADLQLGHSVDIGESLTGQKAWKDSLKSLECNAECKIQDRNRKMAMALQIRNPDLSQKLTPRYSEFMRKWAKKDPDFVQHVHDRLTELVSRAKHSKQKTRSYSFEVMNREKRQFVHEYCALFGCESLAYDEEPKRNVVATASKDDSWLPSMGLLGVVQRESGLRKVPAPSKDSSGSQSYEAKRLTPLTKSQNQ